MTSGLCRASARAFSIARSLLIPTMSKRLLARRRADVRAGVYFFADRSYDGLRGGGKRN